MNVRRSGWGKPTKQLLGNYHTPIYSRLMILALLKWYVQAMKEHYICTIRSQYHTHATPMWKWVNLYYDVGPAKVASSNFMIAAYITICKIMLLVANVVAP